jgi:hypothetical protein
LTPASVIDDIFCKIEETGRWGERERQKRQPGTRERGDKEEECKKGKGRETEKVKERKTTRKREKENEKVKEITRK